MNIPIVPRVLRIWGNLNVVVVNIVVVGLSASAITSAIYLYDDNARYDEALLEPRIPKGRGTARHQPLSPFHRGTT